ncbi:MAG: metallopeptidase TldD-related protein, partial [Acidobacteriota bacterium]
TACRKTPLIADGRVVGRLLDRRDARLRGSDPTGSGRRASFRDRPLPRLGNLFVTGGREGAGEAAGSCRWGILIEELESGRVDPYTGEFRLVGRRGHLLRRGKADRPVRGVQVFGSAVESLDRIEVLEQDGSAVGTTGSCLKEGQSLLTGLCSPPVRIGGLAVRSRTAGTDADG